MRILGLVMGLTLALPARAEKIMIFNSVDENNRREQFQVSVEHCRDDGESEVDVRNLHQACGGEGSGIDPYSGQWICKKRAICFMEAKDKNGVVLELGGNYVGGVFDVHCPIPDSVEMTPASVAQACKSFNIETCIKTSSTFYGKSYSGIQKEAAKKIWETETNK